MLRFLLRSPDGQTALTFVGLGLAVAWGATSYNVGTPGRMGPGFFPFVLGLLLAALGLGVFLAGWFKREHEAFGPTPWRAIICITASALIAGVFLEQFGLAPAVVASTFIGALAEPRANWLRVAVVSVALVGFAWLVFVAGLDLRLPLVRT
ncbi:tripartite tricarboxylate transporter TctB family protein [Aquamicrobium zhengzhouense]|uniref:Tripartite tricarboxylate transporter TctB family protein n=1 Tax=Aquamicrobium zhengzhouense TaxID=2781738 RepID=A0ABS0SHF2_9HYPH|nr:tripartite tricarboxylate transporter TctB family protein [Aquamicrobium zhengzhouense]MBI1622737.1 tripartite tricarboxylate transporter TctB family protein [Aquamicrobium zhengzhouense]